MLRDASWTANLYIFFSLAYTHAELAGKSRKHASNRDDWFADFSNFNFVSCTKLLKSCSYKKLWRTNKIIIQNKIWWINSDTDTCIIFCGIETIDFENERRGPFNIAMRLITLENRYSETGTRALSIDSCFSSKDLFFFSQGRTGDKFSKIPDHTAMRTTHVETYLWFLFDQTKFGL